MSVRNSLLAILARQSAHGYGLKNAFEASTGGAWPLNVGQVYSTLQRLERDGLARPATSQGDDRQEWKITTAGRTSLKAWYQQPVDRGPQRDELTLKVLLALAMDSPDIDQILGIQRDAAMQQLQECTRAKQQADPREQLPWLILLDAMILRTKADLEWLELCRERLAQRNTPA